MSKSMFDNDTHINDEQRSVFEKFKANVSDCTRPGATNEFLLKWLIARDFDLSKAEVMFRRSMEWRQINQVDGILERWTPPEVLTKYYSMGTTGFDKFGCPTWICAYGRTDVRGILHSVSKRDYLRYFVYLAEKSNRLMDENSRRTGKTVSLQTLIVDFECLPLANVSYKPFMEVGMETTKICEANYPEGVRRVFVINVPNVFAMIFAFVKPFLIEVTLKKIRVFGQEPDEWKAALLEEIDADQLPVHYGGTLRDPDGNPCCLTKINMGGTVPKSHYFAKQKLKPLDNMLKVIVSAGAKKTLRYEADNKSSTLRWKFLTEEGDVAYRIYTDENDKEFEVVKRDRVDSHQLMEEGEIVCTRQATYYMEFDNSFSYLRSKTIWYSISLI